MCDSKFLANFIYMFIVESCPIVYNDDIDNSKVENYFIEYEHSNSMFIHV